jgi:hypothetical protein
VDCYYCKGVDTVEEQTTRFCACEIPRPFVVENVPAFVCRLCGDKSFSGETLTALEKIKNGEARVSRVQFIRVFDFDRLDNQLNEAGEPATIGYTYPIPTGEGLKVSEQTLPWRHAALTHSSGPEKLEEQVRESIRLLVARPRLGGFPYFATVRISGSLLPRESVRGALVR